MKTLTYERLHELLNYDPLTGVFTWKERINKDGKRNPHNGKVAGSLHPSGYLYIRIDGKLYLAHRLAYFFVHGYMPENEIDHKNQIKNDNEIKNLREASRICNMQNQKISTRNTSGITGVSWDKKRSKWEAQITKNNKQVNLGRFNNQLDAARARLAAEKEHFTCTVISSAEKYIIETEKEIQP